MEELPSWESLVGILASAQKRFYNYMYSYVFFNIVAYVYVFHVFYIPGGVRGTPAATRVSPFACGRPFFASMSPGDASGGRPGSFRVNRTQAK